LNRVYSGSFKFLPDFAVATIIVCPNCGYHFDRPFLTEKRSGLGFTFGPLGAIKCSKCGYKAGWGAFKREKDVPAGTATTNKSESSPPSPEQEKEKTLDETKYEQS
jgi:hypothetical protein